MAKDCFYLNNINKEMLECIFTFSSISTICEQYLLEPNSENGEKLVEIFQEIEKKMMKVKQNVAKMIDELEEGNPTEFVEIEDTDEGYKLNS